ncbi:DUF4174 domain-containing protein [Nioella aestuarii]|uniref:DUF4174 domain-containing protein n=1 Tax=Nioella aestuarii TaxID=1662864 RepID=UPI003D7F46F0
MRAVLSILLALTLALPGAAQEADTPAEAEDAPPVLQIIDAVESGITLEELTWVSRPIVIFAETDRDPRFQDQIDLLLERPGPLLERDVVIVIDSDPAAESPIRQALRPRGFSLVIIQRDGRVALRKPNPWDVREIMRAIDNLPMRIEEMGLSQ